MRILSARKVHLELTSFKPRTHFEGTWQNLTFLKDLESVCSSKVHFAYQASKGANPPNRDQKVMDSCTAGSSYSQSDAKDGRCEAESKEHPRDCLKGYKFLEAEST